MMCHRGSIRQTASSSSEDLVLSPTTKQLRIYAFHSAIPMVGFGFMDNIVMIQAGEAIDLSLGVAFGLSTLTAAGFGQCLSDVAGFTCGGVVDAMVSRLRLPHHHLTIEQMDLKQTRIYRTIGGCIGVVCGCLLGMTSLFWMDTTKAERLKKSKELQSIFESIMRDGSDCMECERATLWMVDDSKEELWSLVATGTNREIRIHKNTGIVGAAVSSGTKINIADAYQDDRFDSEFDKKSGFRTKSILVVPIIDDNRTIGAIQMINKRKSLDGIARTFQSSDEKLATMLGSHVAAFIRIIGSRD
jgi:putative methionine-R-sulfoxide reductase with GAF domain